jgi:stage V sporulation protein D (sporulation-specific penicillin-binding protein)
MLDRSMRARTAFLVLCTGLALALLGGRLLWLQVGHGTRLRERALEERMREVPLLAPRGYILDRAGRILAESETVYSAYAVPGEVRRPREEAQALSPVVDLPVPLLVRRLRQRSALVWIRRRLTAAQASQLRRLDLPGVGLAPQARRIYPYGPLAAQVLGFAGADNQGLAGVELSYNRVLAGKPGDIRVEYDASNRRLPRARAEYRPPAMGDSVVLTLDMGLEEMAAQDLARAMADTQSQRGLVLAMDVDTGAILALAAQPSFDPQDYGRYPPSLWRDPAVSDTYPPGSTFKPVTAAAALAAGVVTPTSPFYDPGFVRIDGRAIRCWKAGGHGSETFTQVVENSCNVGFAEVGLRLGTERFYAYLKSFGLLGRTGVDLPGEAKGIFPPASAVKPVDLAVMSFGQTLTLTPLQLAAAIASIANGGHRVRPHVVMEILTPQGKVVRPPAAPSLGEAVPPAVAREVAAMMEGVVTQGTGKNGQVPGYRVAGKTGTSQVVVNGRYEPGQYISSFVGFAPMPRPRILCLVILDRPVGAYYGGQVAAPVFARFMAQALPYLGFVPSASPAGSRALPLAPVPRVEGERSAAALAALRRRGFSVRVVGSPGPWAVATLPGPGERAPGGQVLLFEGQGRMAVQGRRNASKGW